MQITLHRSEKDFHWFYKAPPTSLPSQNKGCHCISCSVLIHTLFTNYWQCQPRGFSLCLWLGFVGWLLSSLLSFHCFVSAFLSRPLITSLLFRWRHQNENFSASIPSSNSKTRQNSAHSVASCQGPWRMPQHWYQEKEGEPWNVTLWLSQQL